MTSYGHCLILLLSIVLHGVPSIRVRPGVYDFRRAAQIKIRGQVVEHALAALGCALLHYKNGRCLYGEREYIVSNMEIQHLRFAR
jgi:hypothetical protein